MIIGGPKGKETMSKIKIYKEGASVFAVDEDAGRRSVPVAVSIDGGKAEIFSSASAADEWLEAGRGTVSKSIANGWRVSGFRVRHATLGEALSMSGAYLDGAGNGDGMRYSKEGRRVRVIVNGARTYPISIDGEIVLSSTAAVEAFGGSPGGWSSAATGGREYRGREVAFTTVEEFAKAFPGATRDHDGDRARIARTRRRSVPVKTAPRVAPEASRVAAKPAALHHAAPGESSAAAAAFVLANKRISDAAAREVALALLTGS